MKNTTKIYFITLTSLTVNGCALQQNSTAIEKDLNSAYMQAVNNAKFPNAQKVSQALKPLIKSNNELVFNENGKILMITFTKASYFKEYKKDQKFNLYGESWFTAAPYFQNFCKNYTGKDLLLRTQQMLGLPPKTQGNNDSIVSMWINPSDMFRPCVDPEVIDGECAVTLSGETFVDGKSSWANAPQVSKAYIKTTTEHLNWMANSWKERYFPSGNQSAYPWTALGYTYDWAEPKNPVGMSEFVALKNKPVIFDSLVSLETYCGR